MPRPCCPRQIGFRPCVSFFKPTGVPLRELDQVTLTLDEVESLRLADLDGLYQEQAAEHMRISRSTFSRIVEKARRKVAGALIYGKALRIEEGEAARQHAARRLRHANSCGGRQHGR